jgi:glycosyltransferase involved in cell wall biosynthesis
MKMRILYFSRDYTVHDHRFLEKLAETKLEVFFLRLENKGYGLETRDLPQGITEVEWRGGRKSLNLLEMLGLRSDLQAVIRRIQPDLIHAGPLQRCAFLTALTGYQQLVSMSWGYDLLIDAQKNPLWKWITRYTLHRSAAFVGDCETVGKQAVKHGMDPERMVIFPWGVDLDVFQPSPGVSPLRRAMKWDGDEFVVISTRSWAPIYGVTDLVQAFIEALNVIPHLRLLMLGDGPEGPEIRRLLKEAGVVENVHFPGQVNRVELPEYYRAADVYLSTSYSDGSSISLLEALACGLPVLVSDIPGNQEWVVDKGAGKVGWLYEVGEVEHLTSSIIKAEDNRNDLGEMGTAARKLAEAEANWEDNFPQLMEAYQLAADKRWPIQTLERNG